MTNDIPPNRVRQERSGWVSIRPPGRGRQLAYGYSLGQGHHGGRAGAIGRVGRCSKSTTAVAGRPQRGATRTERSDGGNDACEPAHPADYALRRARILAMAPWLRPATSAISRSEAPASRISRMARLRDQWRGLRLKRPVPHVVQQFWVERRPSHSSYPGSPKQGVRAEERLCGRNRSRSGWFPWGRQSG